MALRTDPRRYVSQLWARLTDSVRDAVQDLAERTAAGFSDVHRDLASLDALRVSGSFRVKGTTQALTAGSTTQVSFPTKIEDETGTFDTTGYQFTAKEPGYWMLTASVRLFNQLDGNMFEVQLWKNGALLYCLGRQRIGGTGLSQITGTVPVEVVEGDVFTVYVYTSGAANVQGDRENTYFAGLRVR